MIGISIFVAGLVFMAISPLVMQTGPRSELSLAIEEMSGNIIAVAGIIMIILEHTGRKKEAGHMKRFSDLFAQKAAEIIPKIEPLYDLAKKSGQIPMDMVPQIEETARQVKEAGRVTKQQLQIMQGTLKPEEKADSLVIPRETFDTKPIPQDPKATPHITPKEV
jgi:hypothetical protein